MFGGCRTLRDVRSRRRDRATGAVRDGVATFTVSPPATRLCLPRRYLCRHSGRMADFLVVVGIVVFVAAMLGLIWGLERV
jgi:hypothetical protein